MTEILPLVSHYDSLEEWANALLSVLQTVVDSSGSTATIYDNKGRVIISPEGHFIYDSLNGKIVNAETVIIDTAQLADAAVETQNVADAAIATAKIANAAIISALIGDAAIVTAKIADLAVTNAKIGLLAVDTAQMNDLAVVAAKIADLAVTAAKIADLAVTNAKIANLAVTDAKIADLAVTNAKVANAAIDNAKIANLTITTGKIGNNAITGFVISEETTDQVVTPLRPSQTTIPAFNIATATLTHTVSSVSVAGTNDVIDISFNIRLNVTNFYTKYFNDPDLVNDGIYFAIRRGASGPVIYEELVDMRTPAGTLNIYTNGTLVVPTASLVETGVSAGTYDYLLYLQPVDLVYQYDAGLALGITVTNTIGRIGVFKK